MSKTRMLDAVQHLDLKTVEALADDDPSLLEVTDRRGRNLLQLACSASCERLGVSEQVSARMVTFLLDHGLDLESVEMAGASRCNSVWFATARGRNATLVKLLIARGATPSGLFAAGWYEDLPILDLLLKAGADVDEYAEDETPFLHCWKNRRFAAVKRLVAAGANVNVQDSRGKTALHYGVEKDFDPALLAALVADGASPDIADRDGLTARQKASRKRDKRFLAALG